MTVTSKTIKITAKATLDEFNKVKVFVSHLDNGFLSYVNDYVIAYVLLKDYDYDVVRITSVKIDTEKKTVFIEFESEIENA